MATDESELYQTAAVERRCPHCGGRTRLVEKDTSSGRDIREYGCDACGWRHAFDDGPALWALMSDKGGGEPEG